MFTGTYLLEMAMKIVALGPLAYANNKLNLFDGLICLFSVLDMGKAILSIFIHLRPL